MIASVMKILLKSCGTNRSGLPMTPRYPSSSSARRFARRGFLAASALAGSAAWAVGTSSAASASGAAVRRAGGSTPGAALAWHDITNQTVNAASFTELVTQSRAWAVSWLAAARAPGTAA